MADVGALLDERLDADELDLTRQLPPELLAELQKRGLFELRTESDLGGLGLSAYNAFRVVERVSACSVPVGQIIGIHNGAGAGALLPALPAGPLRDFVEHRIRVGTVSGWADTEPTGQNNAVPAMAATPTDDGSYLLHGDKLFTGNGPIADVLVVTATVPRGDDRQVCLFFVDTRSPGFAVASRLEFLGSKGLPNAALRFDGVRVPKELVLASDDGDARLLPSVGAVAGIGRLYITAAPALATARRCLTWSRDFVSRRSVDGRPLGDYDQIQRMLAMSAAEVFAMDSVVRWSLLGCGPAERAFERMVAKNICTATAWRTADRTMSLLAGEGLETAESKRRRGAVPLPLERFYRDVRGLRITGNVDFQLDYQAGRFLVLRRYAELPGDPGMDLDTGLEDRLQTWPDAGLHPHLRDHRDIASQHVRALADTCAELARRHPERAELLARERPLILLGRIAGELVTMCLALARATHLSDGESNGGSPGRPHGALGLADVYCTAARQRIAGFWRELRAHSEPDYAGISRAWLSRPHDLGLEAYAGTSPGARGGSR